ncbi:MAG: hypothetical protein AABZ80_08730 [Gemmatimonadota bacterium]
MSTFFPKDTVQWHFEEPTVLRRFSLSLWEMALMTGVVLRLYRAVVLNYGATTWIWLAALGVGVLLFCAMATMHLANFPVKHWLWRAPIFAAIEVSAESVTSLLLIWLGREPNGSTRAEWHDWPAMAFNALFTRELTVLAWAAVLAVVVYIVRRVVLRESVDEETAAEE